MFRELSHLWTEVTGLQHRKGEHVLAHLVNLGRAKGEDMKRNDSMRSAGGAGSYRVETHVTDVGAHRNWRYDTWRASLSARTFHDRSLGFAQAGAAFTFARPLSSKRWYYLKITVFRRGIYVGKHTPIIVYIIPPWRLSVDKQVRSLTTARYLSRNPVTFIYRAITMIKQFMIFLNCRSVQIYQLTNLLMKVYAQV